MTEIRIVIDDDLHKAIKKKAVDIDYKLNELLPVLVKKGYQQILKEK